MTALAAVLALLFQDPEAWELAKRHAGVHRFSTLFTAHDVRDRLADGEKLSAALDWCRRSGVTKVYLESFRDGYQARREDLERARTRFREAGFETSGCITPTQVGKPSTGWKIIACYSDAATQDRLQAAFEAAAALFDEIMVDDFWFTDCACAVCDAARRAKTAVVGGRPHPVAGDGWADYRCELLLLLSRERILAPARRVNPRVKVIVKYPQWYDRFHERGYDVVRESAEFDRIWVGTETRDYADARWGGTPQYEAYFIMRWLGGIGGAKCGGGWYDPYGTTPKTYVEQARQTVLGGARESLLFCYGSLLKDTGPANVEVLRRELPELFAVAGEVGRRTPAGPAAYKPPGSDPGGEPRVFDFAGMAGLPLVPCHEFPEAAPSAFFSAHAMKDPAFPEKLARFVAAGKPVLLTDGLVRALGERAWLKSPEVRTVRLGKRVQAFLELPAAELDALREHLLRPFGTTLKAPAGVALCLFTDGSRVLQNFTDAAVEAEFNGGRLTLAARGWSLLWK